MTSAQVVETSVTNNSSFQNYPHPDDHTIRTTKSDFNELIWYDKVILRDESNIGVRVPNLTQDSDVLNIHCDLTSTSLVDGEESDIIYSFGNSTLRASYGFVLEPRRVIFNPVNKTSISSIPIYITIAISAAANKAGRSI